MGRKVVKNVVNTMTKTAQESTAQLNAAINDLQKIGGEEILQQIPKNLNTDDSIKAIQDATENLKTQNMYKEAAGRIDEIEAPKSTALVVPGHYNSTEELGKRAHYAEKAKEQIRIKEIQEAKADAIQSRFNRQYPDAPTAEQHASRQADLNYVFGEGGVSDSLNRSNRGWRQRTIDGVKERATGIWNTISGNNYRQTTANRKLYNEGVAQAGGTDFVTKNSDYKRMQRQYSKSNADTPETLYNNVQKAQEIASEGSDSSGIGGWIEENTGLAMAIAGGAGVAGGALLFGGDDDDY